MFKRLRFMRSYCRRILSAFFDLVGVVNITGIRYAIKNRPWKVFNPKFELELELKRLGYQTGRGRIKKLLIEGEILKETTLELLSRLVHYREFEDWCEVAVGFELDLSSAKKATHRIIKLYEWQWFSVLREGLNVNAVFLNGVDSFDRNCENICKTQLDFIDIASIRSYSELNKGKEFKSIHLRDVNNVDLSFQAIAIKTGHIFGYSLWSGSSISSCHSYVVQLSHTKQPYIFVWFDDHEPWYLMVGSYKGTRNYIYIPGRDLVILLRSVDSEWYEVCDYIDGFLNLILKYPIMSNRYLSRPTTPAVYSGGLNNLGHFFWNEVQGLFNMEKCNLLDNSHNFVIFRHQFYELQKLFPWINKKSVTYPKSTEDVFINCIQLNYFCVHPTAFVMTSDCASRIRLDAVLHADQVHLSKVSRHAESEIRIWFNLRAHNKVWINQTDGAVLIVKYYSDYFSKVVLVLDGLLDCYSIVRSIREAVQSAGLNVEIVDCTDVSIYTSILWASNIDLYVSTVGSGLSLNSWISEKKGVAHSERSHHNQSMMFAEVRPDINPPVFPPLEAIFDVGHGAYCDYWIDPSVILQMTKVTFGEAYRVSRP